MKTKSIPVAIVGGGPVGLSMALALARHNIPSIVIERNSSTSLHPKARGVNVRTMELFRHWGNSFELLKHEQPKEARRIIWAQSLQGDEITRVSMDDSTTAAFSPIQSSLVTQNHVEDSLYNTLIKHGDTTTVHFQKELISFTENDDGVKLRILNRKNSEEEFILAQYLIAADGSHSTIRNHLGIGMQGPDNLGQFCSVYCEIDISEWTKHRPCIGYFFTEPKLSGRFLASVDVKKNLWIVGLRFSEGGLKSNFTNEFCIEEIRRITGLPDLSVNIVNKSFWTMAAQIAAQYRKNRIFLVGDAAHRLPPTGGFGMNTGIQDAHNLAWKLAFVIKYNISDKFLDTYQQERAPIAIQNINWSTENAKRYTKINEAIHSSDIDKLKQLLNEQHQNLNYSGLDLGFIYHSSSIFSENDQQLSQTPSLYVPTSLPGSRAPHAYVIKNGTEISLLDLFDKEFVLLVGSEGELWVNAAKEISKSLLFPLQIYKIGTDGDLADPKNAWTQLYEMTQTGAVLIRPDGHISWRSQAMVQNPKMILNKVLTAIIQ